MVWPSHGSEKKSAFGHRNRSQVPVPGQKSKDRALVCICESECVWRAAQTCWWRGQSVTWVEQAQTEWSEEQSFCFGFYGQVTCSLSQVREMGLCAALKCLFICYTMLWSFFHYNRLHLLKITLYNKWWVCSQTVYGYDLWKSVLNRSLKQERI